jgi:hypothetical protein
MLLNDSDSRLQLAREHAERLAEEMRRSRRLMPDTAGLPGRASLANVLRRATRRGRVSEPERIPTDDCFSAATRLPCRGSSVPFREQELMSCAYDR